MGAVPTRYARCEADPRPVRGLSSQIYPNRRTQDLCLDLEAGTRQIAWNGKTFGQREREIPLQKFPGSRKIVDLDVCPLDLFSENEREAIGGQCISRGQKWKELCQSPTAIPRDCDTHCLPLMAEAQGYWDPFEGREKRSEPLETRVRRSRK